MSKINPELKDSADQKTWRFEDVFHLGAQLANDSYPERLSEVLEECLPWIAEAIGVSHRRAASMDVEALVEYVSVKRLTGFLICVAMPIRSYFEPDSNSYQFSWGHFRRHWLYGDDLSELLPKIEAWVDEWAEKDRVKSFAAQGATA
jgi:hypothetical protein